MRSLVLVLHLMCLYVILIISPHIVAVNILMKTAVRKPAELCLTEKGKGDLVCL